MSKSGKSILQGAREARAYSKGDETEARVTTVNVPKRVDVAKVRKSLNMTQEAFAGHFGFSTSAVRDWEQQRRNPAGHARAFLTVIEREPEAVRRALITR